MRGKSRGCVSDVQAEQKIRPHLARKAEDGTRKRQPLSIAPEMTDGTPGTPSCRLEKEGSERDSLSTVVFASGKHAKPNGASLPVARLCVAVGLPEGLGQGGVRLLEHEADGRKLRDRCRRACHREGRFEIVDRE